MNHSQLWVGITLTAMFLALAAPVCAAEPAAGNGESRVSEEIPTPSCDRIDYSQPETYLQLSEHFGDRDHIREIAATIAGKTPEDRLLSIHEWMHAHLEYRTDTPYEWRNFDRLVRDGTYGGCADYSVVFGALARACGIPTVWVKTLDAEWIRGYRMHGIEGSWNGHVFLEVYLHDRWMLLDDTQLVLYEDYDPRMRILPGNRYAYDKGGDPFVLVLSSRWQLWKAQTRAFCRDFDLAELPVGKGRSLVSGANGIAPGATSGSAKYPAVFIFYSDSMGECIRLLSEILYPGLTHHLTGRPHSVKHYQEQLSQWAKPGDTIVLLLLADEKDRIPVDYQDLLPTSWSEIEAEVDRNGSVRHDGERRDMHIVLLVARSPAELASLIRKTEW